MLFILLNNSHCSITGRISGLEEEAKEVKSSLSKVQTEKKELQEKLSELEKVVFDYSLQISKLKGEVFLLKSFCSLNKTLQLQYPCLTL